MFEDLSQLTYKSVVPVKSYAQIIPHIFPHVDQLLISQIFSIDANYIPASNIFKTLLMYLLAREGVYAPVGPAFLAHTKQKVNNIVDLTVLRLAFFMGYE